MRTFRNIDEFGTAVGTHLGYSAWHLVTQDQIDRFAAATDDHQWIHVDPVRAAGGPFGTTVAHGYLTLSLVPKFLSEIYAVENVRLGINYGCNRVRFPAPVPVDSRIRAGAEVVSVEQRPDGVQAVVRVTVERHDATKPVCVAEVVVMLVP
ncbi:Acyl dehydratase [Micromonospora pallida]|uniref:Acyl dehydratase n=1 Tax=Micromonospora pallida TaxID=145854 RepID=A0A1C6RSU9_9ACTN|nr:MaoC family dehydratase [Micromonospora pallida]SCL20113.1 Acyl dehydratase [Micromonospora pallida]